MTENGPELSAADLVTKVRKTGDTLDPLKKVTGRVQPKTVAITGALTTPLAVEVLNSDIGLQYLLTHPLYSTFAGVLFGATYAYGRWREKKGVNVREELQKDFRSLVGEPVDLVVGREKAWGGLGRKKGAVDLRWYGMDDVAISSRNGKELGERLNGLIEVAEMSGIKTIVLGASGVLDIMQRDGEPVTMDSSSPFDTTPYGIIMPQKSYLKETKRLSKFLIDKNADEKVLVATIDQCKKLIEKFEGEGDVFESLTQIINEPKILEALMRWKADPQEAMGIRLQNILGMSIAQQFEAQGGSTSREGKRGTWEKLHSTYRVAEGNLYQTSVTQGSTSVHTHPARNLLTMFGYRSHELNEFTQSILEQKEINPDQKLRATVALYELIRRKDERESALARQGEKYDKGDKKNGTLYQRIARDPRIKVGESQDKRRKKGKDPTIGYEHASPVWKRALAAGMVAVIIGAPAYGVGYGARENANQVYYNAVKELGDWDYDHNTYEDRQYKIDQAIKNQNNPLELAFYNATMDLMNADYDLEESVATAALQVGVPKDILDRISGRPYMFDQEWLANKASKFDIPFDFQSPTDSSSTTEGTGDGPVGSNHEIYHVTALSDKNFEGLWYTNTFNTIGVSHYGTVPYIDGGLQYSANFVNNQPVGVSVEQTPDKATEPLLFSVTTPYIDNTGGYITLARPNNTKVVVARIIDKKDPSHIAAVKVYRDTTTGMYHASIDQDSFKAFELPMLEYFLAASVDPADMIHAQGDMIYREGETTKSISQEESNKIKAALGLPATATDEEVMQAIKSKKYSYTPIKDSGVKATEKRGDQSDEEVTTAIAEFYASLPSALCNTANTVDMLATGGKGNIAVGYSVDADGALSEQRGHLWRIMQDGKERDATPAGEDPRKLPVEKPKIEENPGQRLFEDLLLGTELLIGAAVSAGVYRRRREIQHAINMLIEHHVRKTYVQDGSPNEPEERYAIAVIGHYLYASPKAKEEPFIVEGDTTRSIAEKINGLPQELAEADWDAMRRYARRNITEEQYDVRKIISWLNRLQKNWGRVKTVAHSDTLPKQKAKKVPV